jgi:hypothetical protein
MSQQGRLALWSSVAGLLLSGCAGSEVQTSVVPPPGPPSAVVVTQPAPAPVVVAAPPAPVVARQVVVSPAPGGQWELRGAGTTTSPHYWVWVPSGATIVTTMPPPMPQVVVNQPQTTVMTTADGRWQLYGDGSRDRPYMWFWIPRGVTAPPPPAVYRPEAG